MGTYLARGSGSLKEPIVFLEMSAQGPTSKLLGLLCGVTNTLAVVREEPPPTGQELRFSGLY